MQKREKTENKAKVVEQPVAESPFVEGLLYGGYSVISNKTVREKEKFLIRWRNKNPNIPGKEMIKTNRGYFLDGYNIDERSTKLWFTLTGLNRNQNNHKKHDTRRQSPRNASRKGK